MAMGHRKPCPKRDKANQVSHLAERQMALTIKENYQMAAIPDSIGDDSLVSGKLLPSNFTQRFKQCQPTLAIKCAFVRSRFGIARSPGHDLCCRAARTSGAGPERCSSMMIRLVAELKLSDIYRDAPIFADLPEKAALPCVRK